MSDKPAIVPEKPEIDPNAENPPKASEPLFGRALRFVSQRLLNLAVLTALVSIAGFFVIHSYLDKITGIFTYNIAAVVYLSAGANMMVGTVVIIIAIFWLPILLGLAFGVLLGILIFISRRLRKRWKRLQAVTDRIDPFLNKRIYPTLRFALNLNNILTLVLLTAAMSLIAINYGRQIYELMPRFLGGGAPSSVFLVFKPVSDIQIVDLGLPIGMETVTSPSGTPTPSLRSQPVDLLMELSDGLLVRDPQQGIPIVIKNDLLYAVIDAEPRTFSPVVTATPAPSGTPSGTGTP